MNRHVQTIFCDDIRHELGGKLSYIGVYSGHLFVPSFPVTLPKLCLALSVITPANQPFRKLEMRIFKDDEQIAEGILDEAGLSEIIEVTADESGNSAADKRVQVLNSLFMFSPFQIDGPCHLRVRAVTESEELKGLALSVAQATADML